MEQFTIKVNSKLELDVSTPSKEISNLNLSLLLYINSEDPNFVDQYNRVINDKSIIHEEEPTPDSYDTCINMKIGLPRGEKCALQTANVKKRLHDDNDEPIGSAHNNSLLDTQQYEIEFVDGHKEIIAANIIAEYIIAQIDEEGHLQRIIDKITDHRYLKDAIIKIMAIIQLRGD